MVKDYTRGRMANFCDKRKFLPCHMTYNFDLAIQDRAIGVTKKVAAHVKEHLYARPLVAEGTAFKLATAATSSFSIAGFQSSKRLH